LQIDLGCLLPRALSFSISHSAHVTFEFGGHSQLMCRFLEKVNKLAVGT